MFLFQICIVLRLETIHSAQYRLQRNDFQSNLEKLKSGSVTVTDIVLSSKKSR